MTSKFFQSITVEPIAFITMVAVMIEATMVQDMFFTKFCMQKLNLNESEFTVCEKSNLKNETLIKELSAKVANYNTYYLSVVYFTSILPAMYSGAISDHLGRRVPLMFPFITQCIGAILLIVATKLLMQINPLWFVLTAATLSGLSGGTMNVIANTFGYISDITSEENRTNRIIILEAMFFIGSCIGFTIAGSLIDFLHFQRFFYSFLIILFLQLFNLLYVIFYLKETDKFLLSHQHHHDQQQQSAEQQQPVEQQQQEIETTNERFSHHKFLIDIFKVLFRKRDQPHRSRTIIFLLLFCVICSMSAISIMFTLLFSYVKLPPLNLSSGDYSYFNSLAQVINGLSLVCILPLLIKFYRNVFNDTFIGIIGFLSKAFGLIVLGVARERWILFLVPFCFVFSEYSMPTIRSLLSKIVDKTETGKMFAVIAALQNVTMFVTSFVFAGLFHWSMNFFPGFTFELLAIFQLLAALIFLYIQFKMKTVVDDERTFIIDYGEISND